MNTELRRMYSQKFTTQIITEEKGLKISNCSSSQSKEPHSIKNKITKRKKKTYKEK